MFYQVQINLHLKLLIIFTFGSAKFPKAIDLVYFFYSLFLERFVLSKWKHSFLNLKVYFRRGQEITTGPWVHLVVKSVRECCHQHWEITGSRRSRFTLPLALEIIMSSEEVRKSPLALGKIVWSKVLRMLSPTLGNLGS